MTDKKTLLLSVLCALVLVSLSSCSTQETVLEPQKKTYSPSTEKEFQEIEKSEVRLRSVPPAHDLQHPAAKKAKESIAKKVEEPKEVPKLTPKTIVSSHSEERLQEINQNLAFYCMKHRSDGWFSSEEHCLKFTKKVLNECEKKHKLINKVMVNCIKDRLKKRK